MNMLGRKNVEKLSLECIAAF